MTQNHQQYDDSEATREGSAMIRRHIGAAGAHYYNDRDRRRLHQDFGDDEDSYGFTTSSDERLENIARDHEDISADKTQQKVSDEESQNDIEDCSTTPPPSIIKEPSEVAKEETTRLDLSESETPNENAPFNLVTHDGDDSPDIESEESKA